MLLFSLTLFFLVCPLPAQVVFPPDLTINRIELVQTVQDGGDSVPLVAGKSTVARVYVQQLNRPDAFVAGVSAAVRGFRNGTELPGSPLLPINLPITAQAQPDRTDENSSVNYLLPSSWTDAGAIELRSELRIPSGVVEFPVDNNFLNKQFTFTAPTTTAPYRVAYLPVCLGSSACASGDIGLHVPFSSRLFPLADNQLQYTPLAVPPLVWEKQLSDEVGVRTLTAHLRKWQKLLPDSLAVDQIAAWLPSAIPAITPSYSDAPYLGGEGKALWITEPADPAVAQRTLAQEMARNLSLRNTNTNDNCAADSTDLRTDWPGDSGTTGEAGFDARTGRFMPPSRLDFMTNCDPSTLWVGPFHYRQLLAAFGSRAATGEGVDYLVISGSARADASGGRLDAGYKVNSNIRPPASNPNGSHCLSFTGGTSNSTYCFNISFEARGTYDSLPESSFAVKAPLPPGSTRVALLAGNQELASSDGRGAPSISFTAPGDGDTLDSPKTISWNANDPNGRNLTYALFYSADGGTTWLPLAVDLTRTEYLLDPSRIAGGDNVRFRVVASAGLDSGEAVTGAVSVPTAPGVDTSNATLDFGNVSLGQATERTLIVRNSGTGLLTLSGVTVDNPSFIILESLPLQVPSGIKRGVTVRFRPTLQGRQSANLTLTTNDTSRPTYAAVLTANVFDRPQPNAELLTASLDFGAIPAGQTKDLTVTIRNNGNAPLAVSSISTENSRFSAVGVSTPFSLSVGSTRDITVRFSPLVGGQQDGVLNIATNDPSVPNLRVPLTGVGTITIAPVINANPSSLNFGTVGIGQNRALTFTLANLGTAPLNVVAFVFSNPQFSVLSPAAPFTLQPSGQQLVSVRFSPNASGTVNATLTILNTDPQRQTYVVNLSATGVTPQPAPPPKITTLIPSSNVAGGIPFKVTISGSGFTSSSVAQWNGQDRSTIFVNENTIRVSITKDDIAAASTAKITVTNPPPGGGTSAALNFIVDNKGARGSIFNVDTRTCPALLATLHTADLAGNPITSLGAANLRCSEDGNQLNCNANAALDLNVGLSFAVIFHASSGGTDLAQQTLDLQAQNLAGIGIVPVLSENDRVLLLQMDNGVRVLRDFTEAKNREALLDAINAPLPILGSGAAIYDSIEYAIQRLSTQTGRRKAIIIFSSSPNTFNTQGSRDVDAFWNLVQQSGVGIFTFPVGKGFRDGSTLDVLNQLSVDSGGVMFNDPTASFPSAVQRVATQLTFQQIVNYNTTFHDGLPHTLTLTAATGALTFTTAKPYPGCR